MAMMWHIVLTDKLGFLLKVFYQCYNSSFVLAKLEYITFSHKAISSYR